MYSPERRRSDSGERLVITIVKQTRFEISPSCPMPGELGPSRWILPEARVTVKSLRWA